MKIWTQFTTIAVATLSIIPCSRVEASQGDDDSSTPCRTKDYHLRHNPTIFKECPPVQQQWDCSELVNVTDICSSSVASIAALHSGLDIPNHLIDFENYTTVVQEGDFDVAVYLDVLQHLSLSEGDILDYVYSFNGAGGHPILYVRSEDEPPFRDAEEACTNTCPKYLDDIITEDNPKGYMQLVTMDVMGDQFYLFWHSQYNDHMLICNEEMLEEVFREFSSSSPSKEDSLQVLTEEELELARSFGVTPTVECNVDTQVARVRVMMFTKWGGLYRRTYTITRGSVGEKILGTENEVLIPFQVPYVF